MSEDKRKYDYHEDSPGLKKGEDRRAYDRWYYKHHKKPYKPVPWQQKEAFYESLSENYWRKYCIEHDLDPDTWREVKKRVRHEQRVRNAPRYRSRRMRW